MAVDITKVKVGASSVTLDGTEVGHTIGGAEVTIEMKYKDVMVDYYGETVAEKVLLGMDMKVKVAMAESSIANILNAFPHGEDNTDDVGIGRKVGSLASSVAKKLVLHPLENAAGDRSLDVVIWKAVSSEPVVLPFKNDGESVLEVTFQALIDETKTNGNYLGLIGDSV